MVVDLEARLLGRHPPRLRQRPLEPRRRRHVGHQAARRADEMVVMMAAQILGELEAAEVVVAGEATDHPRLRQRGEAAVGRALR